MHRYLAIYLNDQLAMGLVWRELARRAARSNADSDLGKALADVATAIAEDVTTFKKIMRSLGVMQNPVKMLLAIAGERMGRLKLNGAIRSYSPLSRFVELEILCMGIEGKKVLWSTLRDFAGLGRRLPDIDFDELIRRADDQRRILEPFRASAGTAALATPAR